MCCRTIAVTASFMLLSAMPAWAANSSTGNGALALTALVSEHSPTLNSFDKHTLTKLFSGNTNVRYPPGKTISVTADKIVCKTSGVDFTIHSCTLTFGPKTTTITGRKAHEMYATLIEKWGAGGRSSGNRV
jgi:hypothetical protein